MSEGPDPPPPPYGWGQPPGQPSPAPWPPLDGQTALTTLPAGAPVRAPEVLFRKIEDAQVAEWTARFGGPEG